MFKLVFKNGDRKEFELKPGRTSLGRNAANSVVLDASGVSDYHAEIQIEGDAAALVDLGSSNGTFLNAQRIGGRTPLKSFDLIRIDTVEIELVDPAKRRPTAVRAAVTDADLAANNDATRVRPAVSGWSLMGTTGAFKDRVIPLKGLVKVGREKDRDLALDSSEISREHALIELSGDTLTVRDQGSANGTFVNGKRITESALRDGDELKFDVIAFRVQGPSDPAKTAVRAAVGEGATPARASTGPGGTSVMPCLGAKLVITGDPSPGKSFPLQSDVVTIGRIYPNQIVIDDPTLSSNHAEIVREGTAWKIVDKGSTNGTFVNGKRTAAATLKNGDAVALGKVAMRFEDPASGSPTGTVTMTSVDEETRTSVLPVVAGARFPTWAYSLIGFAVVAAAIGGYMAMQGRTGFGKPAQVEAKLQASKLWEQSLGARNGPTTPALGDINGDGFLDVVLADSQGYVLALDGQEGKKIFEVEVADRVLAPPVLGDIDGDGKLDVIVATSSGILHAFNGQGKTIWKSASSLQLGGIFNRPVLVDVNGDGVRDVVVPTAKRGLVAIDGARGWDREVWNTEGMMRGSVVTSPLAADLNGDGVMDFVVATDAGHVVAVSSQQGKVWQIWERQLPEVLYASPALIDTGKQKLVVIATKGEGIFALAADSGRIVWQAKIAKAFFASPVVADANGDGVPDVLAVAQDGTAFALNGLTGDEIWNLALGVTVQASPALFDVDNDGVRDLVVLDGSGSIKVISTARGRVVLDIPVADSGGFVASPVLGDLDKDAAGMLEIVAAGTSGRISAYSLNRRTGRGEAVWPVFLGNDVHAVK